jgi:hypothetical protein
MPDGEGALRKLGTFSVNKQAHVSQPVTMSIPCDAARKWYDISEGDPSSSDSVHGLAVAILSAPVNNITGSIGFTFHLKWTVRFSGPDIESTAETGSLVYADPGYENYFTDSTSDWAGGNKLTLKHSEGGNAVRFSGAAAGVVYELDSHASLLAYSNAALSTTTRVKWAVVAKDYTNGVIFVVFNEKVKAQKYIKDGDLASALPYYGAGPYVVPENPAWTPLSSAALDFRIRRADRFTSPATEIAIKCDDASLSEEEEEEPRPPINDVLTLLMSRLDSIENRLTQLQLDSASENV